MNLKLNTNAPRRSLLAMTTLVLFALSPALSMRLTPDDYTGGFSRSESDQEQRNSSAIASILGEVRSNLSDLLFIKTERYLHNGVAYAPHIDLNELASTGEIKSRHDTEKEDAHARSAESFRDPGKDHDETEPLKTIIRTASDDFRGFIGDLEREVKPWKDPSEGDAHTDGTELLPWYRLMTLSDSHNVRAYLVGAWWLKSKGGPRVLEALGFIDEGIRNNPSAFQLYLMRGYIEHRNLGDAPKALTSFRKAADLALRARPPDGPEGSAFWTNYEEEDARAAARMSVMMEREFGDRGQALANARRYIDRLGEDAVLERQITLLGTDAKPTPPASGASNDPLSTPQP